MKNECAKFTIFMLVLQVYFVRQVFDNRAAWSAVYNERIMSASEQHPEEDRPLMNLAYSIGCAAVAAGFVEQTTELTSRNWLIEAPSIVVLGAAALACTGLAINRFDRFLHHRRG